MRKTVISIVLGFLAGSALLVQAVGPVPFQSILLRDLTANTIPKVDSNKETADSLLSDDGTDLTMASGSFQFGTDYADAGLIRMPNNNFTFVMRNAANTDNVFGPFVNASNQWVWSNAPSSQLVHGNNQLANPTNTYTLGTPSFRWLDVYLGNSLNFDGGGILIDDGTNVIGQRNSTSAQTFRLYETFTDASNYERYSLTAGSDAVILGAETLGTGSDNLSIALAPAGTGWAQVSGSATQAGEFRLYEDTDDGTNYASFKVPALAANTVYTLPADDGDADQVLSTNGSGTLDWVAASSGTGDITDVWGCSTGDCSALTAASGDSIDATAADSTAPVKDGTSPPGTCGVSELFFDTDETAGLNLYGCTSSDTWTLLGDGGGGGGDSVSVNGSAATDANFIDGGGLDWSLNTGATPDEISAKVKPWEKFTANQAFLPASSFATHDTRNTHPVLDFDDDTDECAYFGGFLKDTYAGNGLTVTLAWMATAVTTGDVVWAVAIEAHPDDALDLDSDSFAADNTATATTASATGEVQYTDITFTDGADMDSLAAGESYRLRVCRDANNGSDTMADTGSSEEGDGEIYKVVVRES